MSGMIVFDNKDAGRCSGCKSCFFCDADPKCWATEFYFKSSEDMQWEALRETGRCPIYKEVSTSGVLETE